MKGNSGISIISNPSFHSETMACFYAPVHYEGNIIGVLRGAYLAEEYLQSMLTTTYFGEKADVFLCMVGALCYPLLSFSYTILSAFSFSNLIFVYRPMCKYMKNNVTVTQNTFANNF